MLKYVKNKSNIRSGSDLNSFSKTMNFTDGCPEKLHAVFYMCITCYVKEALFSPIRAHGCNKLLFWIKCNALNKTLVLREDSNALC